MVLALLIAVVSILFLVRTQDALRDYRKEVQQILRDHFTKAARAYGDESDSYTSWAYDVWIPIAMGIVSVIGAVVVIFLAWYLSL